MIRRKKDESNFAYYNRLRSEASRLGLPQGRGISLEELEELVKKGSKGRRKPRSSSARKKRSSTKKPATPNRKSHYGEFLTSDWWD